MARVTEIARFDNLIEAHHAIALLADEGIEAEVDGAYSAEMFSNFGAMGLRVIVADVDAARAEAVLDEARRAAAAAAASAAPDDEDDDDEDDGVGREARPLTADAAQAWAHRTRAIAFLGIGIGICTIGAIIRVTSPPPGIDAAPRAQALFRQAKLATWVGVAVHVVALVVYRILRADLLDGAS